MEKEGRVKSEGKYYEVRLGMHTKLLHKVHIKKDFYQADMPRDMLHIISYYIRSVLPLYLSTLHHQPTVVEIASIEGEGGG